MNEHDLYRVMKDVDRKYTDELHQYAAELVTAKRRKGTMKQNTKKRSAVTRLFPWNIGISAAVVACAVIAVSIGKEVIGQEKQMQVGMSGTSITDQLSVREPLPIEVRAADGIDIDMNLPENGKAEVMRSIDEAQAWIDLLKQSGEYGRETGEGFHPCLEILEMEKEYLDHDIIMCAVPYHFMQGDSCVAQHAFFGGTITESGKLTVETGMVTVSKEMRPLMLQDTEAYCVCFTVPKNTMPEITGFTLNNQIYDCTAPLPDDIRSEHDMTEYLAELPEYQAYAKRFSNELYLRWVEDEIQTADASDRPLPEDCTEVQSETETLTETTVPEPVYTELELHNPEKRVISWEEQDAIMEDGRAKYQEEGGFPIINTKPYIDKFMEPWGDKEAYDMHFAELNELEYKSYIYHMMLNSIDYFSSAEGRMTYGLNEGKTVIHFQTDDASGLSYESTNDADGTPVAEMYHSEAEHIDYRVDLRTNQYTAEHTAETWDFVVSDNDRCMILTDGTGLALNRNDPTWLEIGSNSCLFPQDYAMSRLSDFELWRITGVEDKLGIPCAVIEGQRGDRTFRMYTAVSTGFLMRYEEYYADGSLENLIETTSLTVDQDITVKQFDPDKYTLVEMQYPVDSADP